MLFLQNMCKSANMGSSTIQLHGVDLPDRYANSKLIIKTYFYIIQNACDYIVSVETL